jgi:hypothetical protein
MGNQQTRKADARLLKYRGLGSADRLRGHHAILAIFVDDQGHSWGCPDRSEIENKLRSAFAWIEAEAFQCGVEVCLSATMLPSDRVAQSVNMHIHELDVRAGPHHSQWQNHVVARLLDRSGSVSTLWDDVFTHCSPPQGGNPAAILFCVRRDLAPSSIAFPFWVGEHCEFQKERGIIYDKGVGGQWYLDSQIAHELLHLFGAVDLEDSKIPVTHKETRTAITQNRGHDSVMFVPTQRPIHEYRIDDLTKFLIGWRNSPPDWLPSTH